MNRRRSRAAAHRVAAGMAQRPMRDSDLADLAERCEIIAEAMAYEAARVRTSTKPQHAAAIEAVAKAVRNLAIALKPDPTGELP